MPRFILWDQNATTPSCISATSLPLPQSFLAMAASGRIFSGCCFFVILVHILLVADKSLGIRNPGRIPESTRDLADPQNLKIAVFSLGCFWRSEAVFGCLPGVVRTTVGYAGGSKINPEYRSLGDHAESVQVTPLRSHSLTSSVR